MFFGGIFKGKKIHSINYRHSYTSAKQCSNEKATHTYDLCQCVNVKGKRNHQELQNKLSSDNYFQHKEHLEQMMLSMKAQWTWSQRTTPTVPPSEQPKVSQLSCHVYREAKNPACQDYHEQGHVSCISNVLNDKLIDE